jgi:hypothetical protein
MTRTRHGRHGEICERQNGRIMMTVRPTPTVLDDTDIAMLIGYICNVGRPDYYDEDIPKSDAKQAIHDWEYNTGSITPLTKKLVMRYLTSNYYLAQIEEHTDLIDAYDEDCGVCQALLERVHQIFPSFVVKETEVIA